MLIYNFDGQETLRLRADNVRCVFSGLNKEPPPMISRKWITVCFVGICLWGGLSANSVRGETETMIQESRSNILPDITQTPEEWKERIWYGDDTQFRLE